MRIALDTNLLAHAEGVNGAARQAAALGILRGLADEEVLVPVQALGELFVVLTRKAQRDAKAARDAVQGWMDSYPVIATSPVVMAQAMELAAAHRLALRESVMLAAAAQGQCRVLLSEDMQDGFTWQGVAVRNPFATGGG